MRCLKICNNITIRNCFSLNLIYYFVNNHQKKVKADCEFYKNEGVKIAKSN